MKYTKILVLCLNPECPIGLFIPTRTNQFHCCKKCRNRKNYLKIQKLLKNRYADLVKMIKVDATLEKLLTLSYGQGTYSTWLLKLVEVPIDAALKIAKSDSNGRIVHFFSNYGLESVDGENFKIIKRNRDGR